MTSIYTRRLAGRGVPPPNPTLLYTAAADEHVVLRDFQITNAGGGLGNVLLYIVTLASGNVYLHYLKEVAELQTIHLDMRQELKAGESLYGHASSGSFHVFVTGYVFR